MSDTRYVVAIVVDPEFGERVRDVLTRMPVWLVDSEINRRVAEAIRAESPQVGHTEPGGLTTFQSDPGTTPNERCAEILWMVAGHHDAYSHRPGYSGVEVFGAEATSMLRRALAEYRLTEIRSFPGGFSASTAGDELADSPNYPEAAAHLDDDAGGPGSRPPAA